MLTKTIFNYITAKGATSPMDLVYMRELKFYLRIVNAWPYKEFGVTQRKNKGCLPERNFKAMIVYWTWIFLSIFMYIKCNIRKLDFYKLGHNYITGFMSIVCLQRSYMPLFKAYREIIPELVLKLHLFYFKDTSKYAMKVYKRVHIVSLVISTVLYAQMYFSILFFDLVPLYKNIQSGVFQTNEHSVENGTRYEYAVFHYTPFEHNNLIYSIIFTVNWLIVFDCGLYFCAYDLLVSYVTLQIYGHLKILRHKLENFPKPKNLYYTKNVWENGEMYSEEESRNITELLIENIEYHKMIMKFVRASSEAFGLTMCLYYAFHQVNLCVLLLEMSAMNKEAFAAYSTLTVGMFQQLTQMSIVFELMGSESEKLKDAIYSLPWESMDIKNRKIVLFFLSNNQNPITFKALGLTSIGVKTMAEIIKTSISYYLMLQTVARLET